MKVFMDFEEHKAMKEKMSKKIKTKGKENNNYDYKEYLDILIKKKVKTNKMKYNKTKNSAFKNNYKNFQYDYEEDFYEPDYEY
ncbi:hypothetical protein [Tepidibacter formicigenes]|jgi:hypothetical protein|uniref:Uncharacterized protein n=1 Tax=Tepidibacter formicigenes DSM 15518 TaxID=1123349 RepID=A0A1M6QA86_9FIRM|nr:hypothetical protein [Tepidibacter formicigenes]SHK17101.1 hypothetical protein SAMN02744037_01787 [Tepidibacter formicigenes DSM 15518]